MLATEKMIIVQDWVKKLGLELEIELELEDNMCSFALGEDTIIVLEVAEDRDEVTVYSNLCRLSDFEEEDRAEAALLKSLNLNAFQLDTHGGTIAAVPGGDQLIFHYTTPIANIDATQFSQLLGAFYETMMELRKTLTS